MYRRAILSLAVLFSLLPLATPAHALPRPKSPPPLPTIKPVEPITAPDYSEVPEVQEIAPEPAPEPPAQPTVASGTIAGCGDNYYAQYIYTHESGCRLDATNAGGCVGIGQACPASKLYAACPDLNYACQNEFFTNYAYSAYGGWEQAYDFWLGNSWW